MTTTLTAPKDFVLVPKSQISAEPLPAFNVPEQSHEANIPVGESKGSAAARKYLELTRTRDFHQLQELRAHPDPRVPMPAHLSELARTGAKLKADNQKAYEAAVKTVGDDIAENDSFLDAMGGFKPHPQGAEIRGVLRGMNEQERQGAIGNAIEAMDEELLSAILPSHPLTLGVSGEFKAAMRNRYIQKIAPDALKQRENLARTKAALEAAHPYIMQTFDAASSGIEKYQTEINAAEAVRKGFAA